MLVVLCGQKDACECECCNVFTIDWPIFHPQTRPSDRSIRDTLRAAAAAVSQVVLLARKWGRECARPIPVPRSYSEGRFEVPKSSEDEVSNFRRKSEKRREVPIYHTPSYTHY
eukprot:COSAG06_NODE_477_length_15216_cov_133.572402_3_plen_113_part_00